jgi:DNA polymerase III gamma/tau subunit
MSELKCPFANVMNCCERAGLMPCVGIDSCVLLISGSMLDYAFIDALKFENNNLIRQNAELSEKLKRRRM